MDFSIPPRVEPIVRRVRAFVDEALIPLEPRFLNGSFRSLLPVLAELRAQVKAAGLWAPHLPQAYGGLGLSLTEFAHVSEELGRSPLGHYVFNCQAPDVGNMELLMHYGTEAQKRTYLEPLARGEIRSCFAMTEPEYPGSNPVLMGTTAVKDGDDYVLNGHKWFATGADGAHFAIVMAVTNPEAEDRHRRASQIIVPCDTPGFTLVRNISIMGEPGSDHASHGEIRLENCRVPQENRLGAEGEGFRLAQIRLGPGRIHHCMRWIGICERAFDLMCTRAASRKMSSSAWLADQQAVQHWIAESRAAIDGARLLVLHAAWKMEQEGAYAARVEISTIKFVVANVLQQVLDRAIQVHGALGMTDDTPLAYWYRHERAGRIYDGPDEVHKWVVARHVLGKYRDAGAA
ncbi:acyl-CoA dehydrogenase family protein [Litorilinea aerophila]|uniref:Acyl-CoA dehydrogenase n=1 Tax=Litorilinea aerophila TaxID=1204385 RepID=A0A540VM92_9CHLR|nr:acyl-CoA dehydrogenase family protein [Litorilinea aerophila]MCC9074513.1 acyl-CoA dehydrogenase family protein [Litorilinea aerophila]OUC06110.1 acyl-CoA dehydrogenase [Litorilinea aerophila]GIV75657.1 MAG: acyl-CoA dehydrogenase [Litorilinea sp.]